MLKIHYIFDPMCGWCYGATPLVDVLTSNSEIEVIFHPGGMMTAQEIGMDFRSHIMQADQRITALTEMEFGEAYRRRLESSVPIKVDSYLPTQAIIAATAQGLDTATVLKAIQTAHYLEAQPIYQFETLQAIIEKLGGDTEQWQQDMLSNRDALYDAINETRQLMYRHGVSGFPTFLLEKSTRWQTLPHSQYYGSTESWAKQMNNLISKAIA